MSSNVRNVITAAAQAVQKTNVPLCEIEINFIIKTLKHDHRSGTNQGLNSGTSNHCLVSVCLIVDTVRAFLLHEHSWPEALRCGICVMA